jgi:hypothetical protein
LNVWKHAHHDNGAAARHWKVLSIRPPLRGAAAFGDMLFKVESAARSSAGFTFLQSRVE